MPPCKAQEKWICTQSVDLGRSVRTFCPGGGFLPPTPSAGPLFCKSSKGSFESVKPNRFSALQIQNLAPLGGSFQGATWATSFRASWFWGSLSCFFVKSSRGRFKSVKPKRLSFLPGFIWAPPREISWLGVVFFLHILEREFQKCGA